MTSTDTGDTRVGTLLALAERCEREGPNPRLDYAICVAVGDTEARRSRTSSRHYTRSLDAAAFLVPPTYSMVIATGDHMGYSSAHCCPTDDHSAGVSDPRTGRGTGPQTAPALALCAAALRARYALMQARVRR